MCAAAYEGGKDFCLVATKLIKLSLYNFNVLCRVIPVVRSCYNWKINVGSQLVLFLGGLDVEIKESLVFIRG